MDTQRRGDRIRVRVELPNGKRLWEEMSLEEYQRRKDPVFAGGPVACPAAP